MPQKKWIDPFTRFQVVFEPFQAHEVIVLRSALEADPAMLAFYDELERLTHDHAVGYLLLIYHGEEERTLLREPLR